MKQPVGELIREARLRSGLSQAAVARRAGTSQAAISRIERGFERPSVERAEQILAGMGWRLAFELEPIAEHEAEPRRLRQSTGRDPGERIEEGLSWMRFANDLLGAANAKPA